MSQGTPPIDRFYSNIKEVNVLNQNYIKVYDPILYKHHNKWKLFFDETLAYIFIIQHIYACTNIALGGGFKPLISRWGYIPWLVELPSSLEHFPIYPSSPFLSVLKGSLRRTPRLKSCRWGLFVKKWGLFTKAWLRHAPSLRRA